MKVDEIVPNFFALFRLPGRPKVPGQVRPIFVQFFVCIATGHDNKRIFLGLTSSVQQDLFLGTRMEVPPPFNFLMARGGGGEVKARQVEPGLVEV